VHAGDKEALWAVATAAKRHGLPVAGLLKSGRWSPEVRVQAFAAGLLAMGEQWEAERRRNPVPGPPGADPGPRFYNSMTTTEGVRAAALAGALGV
jgi:hypothetical protein